MLELFLLSWKKPMSSPILRKQLLHLTFTTQINGLDNGNSWITLLLPWITLGWPSVTVTLSLKRLWWDYQVGVTNPIIELHTWQSKYCRLGHGTFVCVSLSKVTNQCNKMQICLTSKRYVFQIMSNQSDSNYLWTQVMMLHFWSYKSYSYSYNKLRKKQCENHQYNTWIDHTWCLKEQNKPDMNITRTNHPPFIRDSLAFVSAIHQDFLIIFSQLDQWLKGQRMKHQFKTKVTNPSTKSAVKTLEDLRYVDMSQGVSIFKGLSKWHGRKWWSPIEVPKNHKVTGLDFDMPTVRLVSWLIGIIWSMEIQIDIDLMSTSNHTLLYGQTW